MDEYPFIQLAKLKADRLKLARGAPAVAGRQALAVSDELPWSGRWGETPAAAHQGCRVRRESVGMHPNPNGVTIMKRFLLIVAAAVASFGAVGLMQVSLELHHAAPPGHVSITELPMARNSQVQARAAEGRQRRIHLSELHEAARRMP